MFDSRRARTTFLTRASLASVAVLVLILMFATPAAGHPEIFVDDNFTDPNIVLDNAELTASGARLLVTPESWSQTTKADFEQWARGEGVVAADPGGVRLASTGGGWSALENAPYSSSYGVATVGAGDYIFILRGYWAGVKVGIGRYDTATGSWENWSDPAIEWQEKKQYFKNGCSMAWDNDNYVYVLAGGAYGDYPRDHENYEPRYGFWRFSVADPSSWERLENTPWHQGTGDSLAWVRIGEENYLYAWLGTTSSGRPASAGGAKFYRFSISGMSWDPTPITEVGTLWWDNSVSPPYGADDGANMVWTGGDYLYCMPGAYTESLSSSEERYFARFVISENRWEDLAAMPHNENPDTAEGDGVDDGGSMVWDGGDYLYALKGGDGNGNVAADNFWRYSISSNSWEALAGVPLGPSGNNGTRLGYAAGRVYYWHANSTGFWAKEPPEYEKSGWFESGVFDAGAAVTWRQVSWQVSSPAGVVTEKKFASAEPLSLMSGEDRLGLLPEEGIATYIVISEVSPTSDPGEYVELYNPTEIPINLSGWYLNVYRNDYTFGAGDVIPAHGYFLISDTDPVCGVAADVFHDLGMADDGASSYVQLRSGGADGPIIDQVGWGTSSSIYEGAPANAPGKGNVLMRKSGPTHESWSGNGYDTDNNANDFLIAEPNPKNQSSPSETPPAYTATYLNTWSRDGVCEEISEENTSVPAVDSYHEEDTAVVSGTVYSGSPDDLDSNDIVYYEVDATFEEGGSGTETLHEASTAVENGNEVTGTSTDSLDVSDGVYYEVDASSEGDEGNWHLLGGTGQEYGGTVAADGTTHYKDWVMNSTDEAAGSYGDLSHDQTLWWYDDSAVPATTNYEESSWTVNIYREGIEDDEVGHTIYADVYKVDGSGNITNFASGSYVFSSSDSAGSTIITCTDNESTEQTLNTGERIGLRLRWTCSTDKLRVYWYKSSASKFSTLTSPPLKGGTYSLDIHHDSGEVTTSDGNVDNIQVTLTFKSSTTAIYHFDIWNFDSGSWDSGQSGSVGTGGVTWAITKTANPGHYVDDSAHVIRVRLWTAGESTLHRVQEDYLVYKVNYTTAGAYSLEVHHDSASVSYSGTLDKIEVAANFKSFATATYHFDIWNFDSSQWESGQSGLVGVSEVTWTISRTADPAGYISPGGSIRVRLRTAGESTAHCLQEDYLEFKVFSASARYRLRWEYRFTGVESTLEGCKVKIYGYNATGDESIVASIWKSSTGEWEALAEVSIVLGEISYTLRDISDYLVGSQIAIKLEDASGADATPTTVCVDYVALEAERSYLTMLHVRVRSSQDNVTWPDWTDVPRIFPGCGLLQEGRYLQYLVELSTEDSQVTPALREFTAKYVSTATTSTGTFTSQPIELGYIENWCTLGWSGDTPENTSISFATRSSADGSEWSDWRELDFGIIRSPTYGCRYLQVRATFQGVGTAVPTLYGYSITYSPDRSPPRITLSGPGQGFTTGSGHILVEGQLSDANPATLKVNGDVVLLEPGSFSTQVELNSGSNTIHLVALDAAGNQSELTLSGTYSPLMGWLKWIAAGLATAIGAVIAILWATGRLPFRRPKAPARRVKPASGRGKALQAPTKTPEGQEGTKEEEVTRFRKFTSFFRPTS